MNYNTSREKIAIREYGRYVQQIAEKCKGFEEREKRSRVAGEIVDLMALLNPQVKNQEDYRQKLWDHLNILSNFSLEVDSPFSLSSKEELLKRPDPLPYPDSDIRHKTYGRNVETLIRKAVEEEDPEKRTAFARCIANYMKVVIQNWNKESVTDELIKNDLRILSDGMLDLGEEHTLQHLPKMAGTWKKKPMGGMQARKPQGGGMRKGFWKQRNK